MQNMRPSGFTGLLALFAILCAIFAGVVTASEWLSGETRNLGTDLQILGFALALAVTMLLVTRFLAAREARTPAPAEPAPGAPSPGFGALFGAMGIFILGLAIFQVATASRPAVLDDYMAIPVGFIFLLGGVLIALPGNRARARAILATLLVTMFAVTFDWIAFVPGERHFSGGISLGVGTLGFSPGALAGRIAFGIPAVLMTLAALVMWTRIK